MTILTGANGYVGQEIARALPDVIPLSIRFINKSEYEEKIKNLSSTDSENITVIHCASSLTIRGNDLTVSLDTLSESFHFFEILAQSFKQVHIIYPSSGGNIYKYISTTPHKETDDTVATTLYTQAKLTHESFLFYLQNKYKNVKATVLRVSNPYGSIAQKGRQQGLIGVAIRCLQEDAPLTLFADPKTVRDYVHFDDLCALIKLIVNGDKESGFELLNVGSGEGHSITTVIQNIEAVYGKKIVVVSKDYLQSHFESPWSVLDIQQAKVKYDWRPLIGLQEGIKKIKEQGRRQ